MTVSAPATLSFYTEPARITSAGPRQLMQDDRLRVPSMVRSAVRQRDDVI